jgi:hypothetical protein
VAFSGDANSPLGVLIVEVFRWSTTHTTWSKESYQFQA